MKTRRKIGICPNCSTILKSDDNYCSLCGQENHDLKVPVGHLVYETVESITHFDTKLYTTLKAIFTSPGKLTSDFLIGKRARHVHPIRFYIFISFIFFLLINKNVDKTMEGPELQKGVAQLGSLKVNDLLDSTAIKKGGFEKIEDVLLINSTDSIVIKKTIEKLLTAKDDALDSLLKTDRLDFTKENRAKLLAAIRVINQNKIKKSSNISFFSNNISFDTEEERDEFKNSIKNKTDAELDSVLIKNGIQPNSFLRLGFRKFANFDINNQDQMKAIIHGIIKGMSIAMFILMPLVAFLLWIFMNRKKYFYEHLIFSVHIHAIYFLFFSIAFLMSFLVKNDTFQDNILSWTAMISLIYLIISLKKVYAKSWLSTIARFFVMSIPYAFLFSIIVVGSLVFGFVSF
jgi:Protein of unknown function (DUF3667)